MQSYSQLKNIISHYNESLVEGSKRLFPQIQKIYSSPRYIDLELRRPGATEHLIIGRGSSYSGLWVHNERVPASLRIKDKYLEILRSSIRSLRIVGLYCSDSNMMFFIRAAGRALGKEKEVFVANYFFKGSLFFAIGEYQGDELQLFIPWRNKKEKFHVPIEECISVIERRIIEDVGGQALQQGDERSESSFLGYGEIEKDLKELRTRRKKTKTKMNRIENDLKRIRKWKELEKFVQTEKFPLTPKKQKICQINFNFIGTKEEWGQKNFIFNKIKSLKKIEAYQAERLEDAQSLSKSLELEEAVIFKRQAIIFPKWVIKKPTTEAVKKVEKLDYVLISLKGGGRLGIGLSQRGNDQLRNSWAKKDDTWFHLDGQSSSHAIYKGELLSPEIIDLIATILAEYSNYSSEGIPILFTQVRNIKGVRGTPGKVIFKKEKRRMVKKVGDWQENISIEEN